MEIKCDCGKRPYWIYMPGYGNGGNGFHCEDCVPRGCSCNSRPKDGNWENGDPKNWEMELDELGRRYPCCEFEYIHDEDYDWWLNLDEGRED